VVAVLDSGINPHPEFADRILPGLNVPDDNDQTNDVCASHGTAVSGVLAAAGNDGLGIAGMDWTMLLIPIVVVDPCSGPESHVAEALVFATDAGADIANMSLQYYAGTSALRDAVLYAHAAGVLMVAASGNNSANALAYPAAWPETIAVGASTNLDGRWSSSNTGEGISLVAPGLSIQTTNAFSGHSSRTGTSFAAPHVSGTASLMLSVDPWLDADSIRQTIEGTTLDLPPSGYDQFTGFGRLDAGAAVMAVRAPADFNDDGRVYGVDLSTLLALWGECPPGGSCLADIDRDGRVDGIDLSILLGRWTG
jgi:subtilisin family serine protease